MKPGPRCSVVQLDREFIVATCVKCKHACLSVPMRGYKASPNTVKALLRQAADKHVRDGCDTLMVVLMHLDLAAEQGGPVGRFDYPARVIARPDAPPIPADAAWGVLRSDGQWMLKQGTRQPWVAKSQQDAETQAREMNELAESTGCDETYVARPLPDAPRPQRSLLMPEQFGGGAR